MTVVADDGGSGGCCNVFFSMNGLSETYDKYGAAGLLVILSLATNPA
jgi:hypothetical protein